MSPSMITGNTHTDSRGKVHFANDFDMTQVVRMYCIAPEMGIVRAWQGHKVESKWLYVAHGSFIVKTMAMDNNNSIKAYSMNDKKSQVLHIPGGHYNGFEATEKGSVLMVFSDVDLEASKADDIRQSLEDYPWIK